MCAPCHVVVVFTAGIEHMLTKTASVRQFSLNLKVLRIGLKIKGEIKIILKRIPK